jgi:hypothetical protein
MLFRDTISKHVDKLVKTNNNMKKYAAIFLAVAAFALASQVQAGTVVFSDNFNTENGGVGVLNYSGFANWTVSGGSVDLIGAGTAWDMYPGNGLYVDLDGSAYQAGTMTSTTIPVAPGNYALTFDLGGSQRPGYDNGNTVDVNVEIGVASATYIMNTSDPLTLETIDFSVSSAQNIDLVFHNLGGDNVGAILDNVTVSTVPDGGLTVALLGGALVGLQTLRRKLR